MKQPKVNIPLLPEVLARKELYSSAKPTIIGLTREELHEKLLKIGTEPKDVKMRLNQVWRWIYQKGITNFESMHNISKPYRSLLNDHFHIRRLKISEKLISSDGTKKYLLSLDGCNEIEAVYIPEK